MKVKEGYKMTEVGVIPEDWLEETIKDLSSNITTGKLDANAMVPNAPYRFYTCAKDYYYIDKYAFDDEALLISGNGEHVGYVHYYKGKFNAYQRTYVLTQFKSDVQYLRHYLNRFLRAKISTEKSDSTTPYIKKSTIEEMVVCHPSDSKEEISIANALSDIDSLIMSLDNLIAKKKNIKQGAMQNLLTGKIRLEGYNDEWVEKSIDGIGFVNKNTDTTSPQRFYYIDLGGVSEGKITSCSEYTKENAPSRAQRQIQLGDILYQTVRPYQRNNLFIDFEANRYIASTGYAVIRCFEDIDSLFIYYMIHQSSFVDEVMENCTGTGYPAITPTNLAKIKLVIPKDKKEQTAIATILSDIDKEIESLQQKRDKYIAIKEGMMQQLLTGKIRLV